MLVPAGIYYVMLIQKNSEMAWNPELVNYWAPVDYYVGGDHAVAHLLYIRFWTHDFQRFRFDKFLRTC